VLDLVKRAGRPPLETLAPVAARELHRSGRRVLQPETPALAERRDIVIPGPGGDLPLRLYRGLGTKAADKLPALVYFHGGGWVIGDRDTHDVPCAWIANAARCAVVSVDYRLAPEHKFPSAVGDAIAATRWVAEHADPLGLDPARLAVGGDSAGGNLAAVVAIHARERGPALRYQVLIYPAVDFVGTYPSYDEFTSGVLLTKSATLWFRDHYLRGAADRLDWRASPLLAASHAGLPPATIVTAELDPVRDEGFAYAEKLRAAGVKVAYRRHSGQLHGFLTMGALIKAAEEEAVASALEMKAAFDGPG
jgi:acetyl esterase